MKETSPCQSRRSCERQVSAQVFHRHGLEGEQLHRAAAFDAVKAGELLSLRGFDLDDVDVGLRHELALARVPGEDDLEALQDLGASGVAEEDLHLFLEARREVELERWIGVRNSQALVRAATRSG